MKILGVSRGFLQVFTLVVVILLVVISVAGVIVTHFGLAQEGTAGQFATYLGLAQLDLGIVTGGLVVLFGLYGAEQVYLARLAIDQERAVRRGAQRAELLRMLGPLLQELGRNRIVAFGREWRLRIQGTLPNHFRLPFERRVFDAVLAGPAWTTPDATEIWAAVEDAYSGMALLDLQTQPMLPEWTYPVVAIGATAWMRMKAEPSVRWYLRIGFVGLGISAIEVLVRSWLPMSRGEASITREKIEQAMEQVYPLLTGKRLNWSEWDRTRSHIMTVSAPKQRS